MLERLKYKNHIGEVFESGAGGIYVNTNDLRNYEWAVTTKGNRITAMDYSVRTKTLPVIIACESEAEGIAVRNRLFEITEKDVLAMQHGQIIIGDYYFKCFVTKSEKSSYLTSKRSMALNLTLTSDYPYWVKETTFVFRKLDDGGNVSAYLDYCFDYPVDYTPTTGSREINNTGFVGSNFRMVIYGACVNPAVYINGHKYQVNCTVAAGEYLTIDSIAKTVFLTAADGTVINEFNSRDRDSYIFEKIQAGNNSVLWEGDFGIDLTLLEERSEPKWTLSSPESPTPCPSPAVYDGQYEEITT